MNPSIQFCFTKSLRTNGSTRGGSAILIVVLVMGALSLFTLTVWRNTIFLYDIVLKKQEYERNFRATEAALNMGIALCKKYPKKFFILKNLDSKVSEKPFSAVIAPWLSIKDQKSAIKIYPHHKAVLIRAQLIKGDKQVFGLRCTVELAGLKGKKQLMEVKNWTFDTR